MKTASRKFVWLLAPVMLVLFALLLLRTPQGPKPGSISLSVSSLTNNPAGGFSALFTISNANGWSIAFRPGLPQVKSNRLWSPVEITAGDMPRLGPGQWSTFLVAAPTNGEAWRVPVVFCSVGLKALDIAKYHTFSMYQKLVGLRGGRPPSPPPPPVATNYTPEVTR